MHGICTFLFYCSIAKTSQNNHGYMEYPAYQYSNLHYNQNFPYQSYSSPWPLQYWTFYSSHQTNPWNRFTSRQICEPNFCDWEINSKNKRYPARMQSTSHRQKSQCRNYYQRIRPSKTVKSFESDEQSYPNQTFDSKRPIHETNKHIIRPSACANNFYRSEASFQCQEAGQICQEYDFFSNPQTGSKSINPRSYNFHDDLGNQYYPYEHYCNRCAFSNQSYWNPLYDFTPSTQYSPEYELYPRSQRTQTYPNIQNERIDHTATNPVSAPPLLTNPLSAPQLLTAPVSAPPLLTEPQFRPALIYKPFDLALIIQDQPNPSTNITNPADVSSANTYVIKKKSKEEYERLISEVLEDIKQHRAVKEEWERAVEKAKKDKDDRVFYETFAKMDIMERELAAKLDRMERKLEYDERNFFKSEF